MKRLASSTLVAGLLVAGCGASDDAAVATPSSGAPAVSVAPATEAALEETVRDLWDEVVAGDDAASYRFVSAACQETLSQADWTEFFAPLGEFEAELAGFDLTIQDVPLVVDVNWEDREGPTDQHRAVRIGLAYGNGAILESVENEEYVQLFGGDQMLWVHDGEAWRFDDC